ncbi:unnamed protein product, partial [Ectocarpus sp. 12 AP-2014]
ARRARLRNNQLQYLETHPEIHIGHAIAPGMVTERRAAIRDAECHPLVLPHTTTEASGGAAGSVTRVLGGLCSKGSERRSSGIGYQGARGTLCDRK